MRPSLLLIALTLGFFLSCSTNRSNQVNSGSTSVNTNSNTNADASMASTSENFAVVLRIPVSPSGITYANTGIEESEPWGPSGFSISPDGSFLIVNTAANNILRFRADGTQIESINLPDAVGITDVVADQANLYVLDESAVTPAVVRVSAEGEIRERRALRPAFQLEGLSGLRMSTSGAVLLEFEGGASLRRLDGRLALNTVQGRSYSVSVPPLPRQPAGGARAVISEGRRPVAEVRVSNLIAGISVLPVQAGGDLFVLVDELAVAPKVAIDQTIHRFRSDGTFVGYARIPVSGRYTHVEHSLDVRQDGQAYAMLTYPEYADIIRLEFASRLDPILPQTSNVPSAPSPSPDCGLTRPQIINTARRFLNNRVSLNLTNLNGSCSGRIKPRYLGESPGEYVSVAYDWGGWDTVEAYNQRMTQNQMAGDIETLGVEECSSGVDCSGFVTRCWGITNQKYGTSTLADISSEINVVDLRPGDVLNFAGKHVILFDRFANDDDGGNGVMAWESTTTNKADRVVYRRSSWRRLIGYVARRYKRVC